MTVHQPPPRVHQDTDTGPPWLRYVAPWIPYGAVLIGLHLLSNAWTAMLLYHAGMAAVITATRSWTRPRSAATPACRRAAWSTIGPAALAGPSLLLIMPLMDVENLELRTFLEGLGLSGTAWILFILHFSLINPVLEEFFWRGYLGSPARGITASDVLFAGYHVLVLIKLLPLGWAVAATAALIVAAWTWRQSMRPCEGTLTPILSHAAADISVIVTAAILI